MFLLTILSANNKILRCIELIKVLYFTYILYVCEGEF